MAIEILDFPIKNVDSPIEMTFPIYGLDQWKITFMLQTTNHNMVNDDE